MKATNLPLIAAYFIRARSRWNALRGNALEQYAAWAGVILAPTLHQLQPRRLRMAFFLRSNSNLYEQVDPVSLF